MTDGEWTEIERELTGLWGGTTNADVLAARLEVWRKRWCGQPIATIRAALEILEHRTFRGWPPPAEMHAAVKQVTGAHTPVRPSWQVERPLTSVEWLDRADVLVSAAKDRIAAGRGYEGDVWHAYLLALADFYERNAARVRAGEDRVWPPPLASHALSGALKRAVVDTSSADAAERKRRLGADDGRE